MASTGRDAPAAAGQHGEHEVQAWTVFTEAQVIDRMAAEVRALLEKAEQYWDGYDPDPDRYVLREVEILADIRRAVDESVRLIAERNILGSTAHRPSAQQMADTVGVDISTLTEWSRNPLSFLVRDVETETAP